MTVPVLDAAEPPPGRRILILGYHVVADVPSGARGRELIVGVGAFHAQVELLHRRGYRLGTAEDLIAADADDDERLAVLTFDDGYSDALTTVVPALAELGGRATFFVTPGHWGDAAPWVETSAGRLVDVDEARALAEAGMELGAHTMTHADLRTLSEAAAREEIERSKAEIEALTGQPCRSFAYPFGSFRAREEELVRAAGFEVAFAWGRRWPWRRYAMPRIGAPVRGGAAGLAVKLAPLRRRAPGL